MIKSSFGLIKEQTLELLTNWKALAIFAGLYALLLATLYGFVATREATIVQVVLTLSFIAAAPALFFILQAVILEQPLTSGIRWYAVLVRSCRLALATLPVLLIGWLSWWALNHWQAHYPVPPVIVNAFQPPPAPQPLHLHWPTVIFESLRGALLIIVLPLIQIRLWSRATDFKLSHLSLSKSGLGVLARQIGNLLARALMPQSVLVYALGLVLVVLIPYAVLFTHLPINGAWRELSVFVTRLVLVFLCTLTGWTITLRSLTRLHQSNATPEPVTETVSEEIERADESR